jgi:hypothetical protein
MGKPQQSTSSPYIVKLRGLPFEVIKAQIIEFLKDVDLYGGENGIHLMVFFFFFFFLKLIYNRFFIIIIIIIRYRHMMDVPLEKHLLK